MLILFSVISTRHKAETQIGQSYCSSYTTGKKCIYKKIIIIRHGIYYLIIVTLSMLLYTVLCKSPRHPTGFSMNFCHEYLYHQFCIIESVHKQIFRFPTPPIKVRIGVWIMFVLLVKKATYYLIDTFYPKKDVSV